MEKGTLLQEGRIAMKHLGVMYVVPVILGAMVLGMSGCSKKAVKSGGETQSSQEGVSRGSGGPGGGGYSSNYPDTAFSGQDDIGGLRGLDRNPAEERLGGSTLMAKSDPGGATRQLDEIRAEQAASVAAGLRDVFFGYDSFSISEEGRQALARDAEWIKFNPGAQLKIEGHCDERGTSAYNLVLGEKRAKAVRNYLVELGVTPTNLAVVSYGKERPFCAEHSEACHAQNRRGHIVVKTGK